MKPNPSRRRLRLWSVLGMILLLLVLASASLAAVMAYSLPRWTVDSGGGASSAGGSYSLSGAIGQADAGSMMSCGSYRLYGGYWGGAATLGCKVFLPQVTR